ncbi:hypothetical protein VTO73DRAFT_2386 [Trametes versicolor]
MRLSTLDFAADVAIRSFAKRESDSSTSGSDGAPSAYLTSIRFVPSYRVAEINKTSLIALFDTHELKFGGQSPPT